MSAGANICFADTSSILQAAILGLKSKGNQREKGTKTIHYGSLPNNRNPGSVLTEQDNSNWLFVFF